MKKMGTAIHAIFVVWLAASLTACGDDANGQDSDSAQDFLQDVSSGSVDSSESDFVLQLQVSPNTAFFSESPGTHAGTLRTEVFVSKFPDLFREGAPNALLTVRKGDGVAQAVAMTLQSATYDSTSGIVEYTASQLERILGSNRSGASVEVTSIAELGSSFGAAFLYIDGSFTPNFDGPCGDGAGLICPITSTSDSCVNTDPSPAGGECCSLGGSVTCDSCSC